MDEWTLNDLLECSVCLDRLDTSSKVLPCQHTFCRKCLLDIYQAHKELRCPECRVLIECGIDELPTNVLLMRILEGMKNPNKNNPPKGSPTVPPQGVPEPRHHHHRHHHPATQGSKTEQPPKQQSILPGQPCARAIYSYASPESGDLNFKKGDLILLRKKVDANWFHGECNGNRGVFPSVYVDVMTPLPSPVPQCKALYDFKMSSEEEEGCLAFKKGEVITVIRRVDENWAEGKLGHKIGIFPLAFVEMNHVARALMKLSSNSQPGPSKVAPPTPTSEETTPLIPTTEHKPAGTISHLMAPNPALNAQNRLEPSSSSQSPSSSTTPNSSTSTSTPSSTAPSSPASPPPQHTGDKPPPPNPRSTASASHAQHREKRHSLNLLHPANPPVTQRYSGEVTAPDTNVPPEKLQSGSGGQSSSRGHRHKRSVSDQQGNVQLPAVYIAMYPYKPQKADELELKKGILYTVTEKCQDGWFRGTSQVTHKSGVFPGNYVALPKNQSSPRSQPNVQGSPGWGRQPAGQPIPAKPGQNPVSDRPYMDLAKSVLAAAQAAVQNVTSASPGSAVGSKPGVAQSNLNTPPELPPRSTSPCAPVVASSASISSPWHSQVSSDQSPIVMVTPSSRGPSSQVTISTAISPPPNVSLMPQSTPNRTTVDKVRDKKSLGSGLMRRLATIKNSKSPPPSTYSMDNPVFDDGSLTGTDIVTATPAVADMTTSMTPVHTRSGSCPSQLLQQPSGETPSEQRHRPHHGGFFSSGSQRIKHKEPRPNIVTANPAAFASRPLPMGATSDSASPMNSSHRKSNSLDNTLSDPGKKNRALFPPVKERFRCIVAYPPNSEYELALQVGDVIYVHKKRDDGWYKGTQERTGRTGLFPASFVESL